MSDKKETCGSLIIHYRAKRCKSAVFSVSLPFLHLLSGTFIRSFGILIF